MQKYKVILTWEAIYDITSAAEYIESEFGIERSDRFQRGIYSQMRLLETIGRIFSKTLILYKGYTIYKMLFLPSIIFYIIKEPQKEIHILRVLREESNWKAILHNKSNYTYPTDIN